ncbi:hypothetical protein [Chondromyces crocatus]|uniref:Uncharacterized protein n=1 Tax=Chondromyces crocatus TaxID=52 RepID=A0A0K1EBI3_CHOCO|nr:hypothetical protein [Chondromyces crocatus]AKT37938.1 uncharacterized protein CMC5_020810 [Chondromyces crocatus]
MSALSSLSWEDTRERYDERIDVHEELLRLHDQGPSDDFSQLLVGLSNPAGNYSAAEHHLGPKILGSNSNVNRRLHDLAGKFRTLTQPRTVPQLIRAAGLSYLAIGVGSEASCLMNPRICWVANTRSIWTHLVIKHADNFAEADEELRLYRDNDTSSEMAYRIWAHIHGLLDTSMTRVSKEGVRLAQEERVEPGQLAFLWADAIASALYAEHHG